MCYRSNGLFPESGNPTGSQLSCALTGLNQRHALDARHLISEEVLKLQDEKNTSQMPADLCFIQHDAEGEIVRENTIE